MHQAKFLYLFVNFPTDSTVLHFIPPNVHLVLSGVRATACRASGRGSKQ